MMISIQGKDVSTGVSIGIEERSVSSVRAAPAQKIWETDGSKVQEKLLADLFRDENTM